MRKEVTWKNSGITGMTIMLLFIGFFSGSMPEVSISLIVTNLSLAILSGFMFYVFWKKNKYNSKRYFSLFSYVMINCLAIYFAIPFLRLNFLTTTFWVGIIVLLVMVTLPYIYSREILFGIQKPRKSKLGKIFLIFSVLIMAFGSVVYIESAYSSSGNATNASIILFLVSLLFLFISPVMLIKPKKVDEISKEA